MKEQKLLLTHYHDSEAAFLFENNRLVQIMLAGSSQYSIGDIYIGRIKNIIKGMNAAFVELAPGSVAFLPLTHFNPKTVLNRTDAENIKCGDEILVQVTKEAHKTKEATLTTDISFSGKNLVLIPYSHGICYSKKLDTPTKDRLRCFISEVVLTLFGDMDVFFLNYGLVVRTNAAHVSLEELSAELHDLFHKAVKIVSVADKRTVFSCLHKETSFYEKVLNKNFVTKDTDIITDDFLIPQSLPSSFSVRKYDDPHISMHSLYGLEEKIKEAVAKKVWLKCGGYLIIEPTEALTVIDVNSGKTGKPQNNLSPDTFHHRVNCDAVPEIVRQLRLRNLSGIIVVDFLKTSADYNGQLLELLKKEAAKDPVQTCVIGMTALGLVEITRKKTEAPLHEKLSQNNNATERIFS